MEVNVSPTNLAGKVLEEKLKKLLNEFLIVKQLLGNAIDERDRQYKPVAAGKLRLLRVENRITWIESVLANPTFFNPKALDEIVSSTAPQELKWAKDYVSGAEAAELKTEKEFRENTDYSAQNPSSH